MLSAAKVTRMNQNHIHIVSITLWGGANHSNQELIFVCCNMLVVWSRVFTDGLSFVG